MCCSLTHGITRVEPRFALLKRGYFLECGHRESTKDLGPYHEPEHLTRTTNSCYTLKPRQQLIAEEKAWFELDPAT